MVIYHIKYIFKLLYISDLITYSLHNFSRKQSCAFPENVSFFLCEYKTLLKSMNLLKCQSLKSNATTLFMKNGQAEKEIRLSIFGIAVFLFFQLFLSNTSRQN